MAERRDRVVEHAHVPAPLDVVPSAITARDPTATAGCEPDVAVGVAQVRGDLTARLAGADDEHAARRQGRRVAELVRVELGDARIEVVFGSAAALIWASCGDDSARPDAAAGSLEPVAIVDVVACDVGDLDALLDRCGDALGVVGESRHELTTKHERAWIWSVVLVARQDESPVRAVQCERIPAAGAPRLRHPAPVQDYVFDPALRQVIARRQSCLPCTDDDDIHCAHSVDCGSPTTSSC